MDKYRAELESETRLTLKRMDQEDTAAPIVARNQEDVVNSQNMINDTISQLAHIMLQQNQPKEIVFDDDGNPIGVRNVGTGEVKSIIKNDEGLPVGLEWTTLNY